MAVDIKVPSVGESISEGTIARWLKAEGARVKAEAREKSPRQACQAKIEAEAESEEAGEEEDAQVAQARSLSSVTPSILAQLAQQ